jgi:hypothetical protein
VIQVGDRIRCTNGTDFHGCVGTVEAIARRKGYFQVIWDRSPWTRVGDTSVSGNGGEWNTGSVERISHVIEYWRL